MIHEEWVVAIIPARANSKRLPGKNLLPYLGKPLVQHALDQARASAYIDDTILSSDSKEILALAKPPIIQILRPTFLASDLASSEAVIAHALYYLPKLPDWFILLQPTSPLRTAQDIDTCLLAAQHSGCAATTLSGKVNGAVYVSKTTLFLETLSFKTPVGVPMPSSRSMDIDTITDYLILTSRNRL